MGIVLSNLFAMQKTKYRAIALVKTQTFSSGVLGALTWVPGINFQCIYWTSNASHAIFDVTFRTDVQAYIVALPEAVDMRNLPAESRVAIVSESQIQLGAVNHSNGYNAGVTTLVVNGFSDSTYPIHKGDILKIGTDLYYIQSTVQTTSVTTSLTFCPALKASILDKAEIQVYDTLNEYLVTYGSDIIGEGEVIYIPLKASDV